MSMVDNCILTFSICEDEDEKIHQINSFFGHKGFISVDSETLPIGWYGGTKMLETPLFIAAFNYFNEGSFINRLKTLDWEYPKEVQLMIKRQDDDMFSIVNIME